jgi:hypothetical protein
MTRPFLVTKFRGTGQTECEVFQNTGGTLTSLFTYGTAGLATDNDFKPGSLSTHWKGAIYAIAPEEGIYKNTPPETSGVLLHSFTSPDTGFASYVMDWQVVFKDDKSQLFTVFKVAGNNMRMVFIDEEDNVTETGTISYTTIASTTIPFMRSINFGNKLYSDSTANNNTDLLIVDPISESVQKIDWSLTTSNHRDLAIHSGVLYGYTQESTTTVGEGNILWNMSAAIPYKLLEWEAYQPTSNEFPQAAGQNLIFSDGENLMVMGYGSGTTLEEIDVWRVNFDGNGVPNGITSVMDTVFGFRTVPDSEVSRYYASRDIETELGEARTNIHIVAGNGSVEGVPTHHYEWRGPNMPATYLGLGNDAFAFDTPSWKVGGGARTFSNQNELDFIITNVAPTGSALDITYFISGSANPSGVAICPKYNNLKDSPFTPATVSVIDKGFASGSYIAGLSTGESGVLRWGIADDNVAPGDIPNFSAFLIRTS